MRTIITGKAKKVLSKLDKDTCKRIALAIEKLSENHKSVDIKKLKSTNIWRLRVGDYRILIQFNDSRNTALILDIKRRKDAYKDLS